MTDQTDKTTVPAAAVSEELAIPPTRRVFKIGATRIVEDEATAQLGNEAIRALLRTVYPEVANALIRERVDGDVRLLEFLAQPGIKG